MSRWRKVLLILLSVFVLVLVSIPWWLGLALRPVLRSRGVTFDRYERVGYTAFRLHHVSYQRGRASFTAQSVGSATPVV